jgi:hypothetical protein
MVWTASDLASLEYHSPLPELGNQPIGKRMTGKDGRPRLVWALRKLEEDYDSAFLLDANFNQISDGF